MLENPLGTVSHRPVPSAFEKSGGKASLLDVEFSERTDVGKIREHNEDSHGHVTPQNPAQARSHGWLFVLADGVGGHDHGEVASQMAVDCLMEGFRGSRGGEPHTALLARLAYKANTRIYEAGHAAGSGGIRMATTLVACALRHDRAVIAHAGDSRCYLIRRSQTTQITRDHTVANEHVRLGLISAGESSQSSNRHLLLRSLGNELLVKVDINQVQVIPGDVLVQCCDGLHGSVEPADLARIVGQNHDLEEAAKQLLALANERDGSDNISVQLIRVKGVERVGMYRGRPYILR